MLLYLASQFLYAELRVPDVETEWSDPLFQSRLIFREISDQVQKKSINYLLVIESQAENIPIYDILSLLQKF